MSSKFSNVIPRLLVIESTHGMKSSSRPPPILLLCCVALFADAALGQSISILRKGESEFWVEAATPPDTTYRLQASANLHLWVDLNDAVSGQASNQLDFSRVSQRFFRLTPWTPPAPPITIVLLGDSTVADFTSNLSLFSGWGQGMYRYFKPNVRVVNLAMPGLSSKEFLASDSDEKAKMLAIKPDFVLEQFGMVDDFGNDSEKTTLQEFADNLKTIVQIVRGFNGIPILITPRVHRI